MNTNLNMQTVPIDRLKPAKYNPRKDLKPGDPAYEKIKRSLHDFGYVDPIVWNEVTGNIVGGHQRYKVLKAEGATEVDCVVVHIENPSDEKALNIALNKATGDWEPTALADLLRDLQSAGYDLGATGFDAAEVDDLFSRVHDKDVHDDDCDIDPDEVTSYVQTGDIWTLGRHRMMCGDSTSPEAVDLLMDGIRANLVVTDPPYNVAYESADGKKIQNDSMLDMRSEQTKPKERTTHAARFSHNRYPLSGLLHCPRCGAKLIHKTAKCGSYWACSTNLKVSAAACKGIWLPEAETRDWDIHEPVVPVKYRDEYGMTHFTAYPLSEYEWEAAENE